MPHVRSLVAVTAVIAAATACGSTATTPAASGGASQPGLAGVNGPSVASGLQAARPGQSAVASGPGGSTGGGATPGQPGVSSVAGAGALEGDTGGAAALQRTPVARGVIRVGAIIPKGNAGAAFGVSPTDTAPSQAIAELNALTKYINSHGGVAGRQLALDVQQLDRTDESASTQTSEQNAICVHFTQDSPVAFVVAFADAHTHFANACYAQHHTPILTGETGTESDFRRQSPWLMPAPVLNISRMARLMPLDLAEQHYMTQHMAVLSFDESPERPNVEKFLVPGIEAHGGKVVERVFMNVDYQSVAADTANAVLKFKAEGIDRVVIFAPGGGAWLIFAEQAESQRYFPRYAISTMDSPNFTAGLLPPDQLPGTVGPGYVAAVDEAASQLPPPGERQKLCWRIANSTGSNYSSYTTDGILALDRCEGMFLTQAGMSALTGRPFVASQVQSSFFAVGTTYPSMLFPRLGFKVGKADSVQVFAPIAWDAKGCGCMKYAGTWQDIPDGV